MHIRTKLSQLIVIVSPHAPTVGDASPKSLSLDPEEGEEEKEKNEWNEKRKNERKIRKETLVEKPVRKNSV